MTHNRGLTIEFGRPVHSLVNLRSHSRMQNRIARTLAVLMLGTVLGVGVAAQGAPQGPPPGAGAPRQGGPGGPGGPGGRGGGRGGGMAQILMESDAFPDGGIVPAKYSANGGNTMP